MDKKKLLALLAAKSKAQQDLINAAKSDNRDSLNDDEVKQFNDLQKEIENLKSQIEIAEKMEENEKFLNEPTTEKVIPANFETQKEKLDDGGFKNVGEFMYAVKFGDSKGRLKDLATSDVGILIPPQFSQTIMALNPEQEIIMPRATVIPAGNPPDAPFIIPYLQQGDLGALSGVALTWNGEGNNVSSSADAEFKDMTLTPQEVSGLSTINNKTLQNWQAAGSFVEGLLRQAFITGRDYKFLRGSGTGCPLGMLNAPGAVQILRNTAATIKYSDVVNMLGRLLPDAMDGAFFLASITALPTLMQLQDGMGRYIFIQGDATKGIPPTLAGLPVKFTGKIPTLGNCGDLVLMAPKYYLIKPGSGPYVAISEHVKFTSNKTVFKIVAYIDGQPWVKDSLLLEDQTTRVSPYVILK